MRFSEAKDQQLVKLYIHGNEAAFEALLNRYKDKIFQNIYFMVHDRELAEDIFQDTLVKVINTLKAGRYNEEGKFYPWVARIAHNLTIDHFRKASKMRTISGGHSSDDDDGGFDIFKILKLEEENIEDHMVRQQIEEDVRKLVDYLPQEQREVVEMRHIKGMSFKDISDTTGVSINTALGRMRYALINIRKMIDKHGVVLTEM